MSTIKSSPKLLEETKLKNITLDINLNETFNSRQSAERMFGLLKNNHKD